MSSDLTFITNEGGQSLLHRFTALIKDTRYFDCLVGYFYASGFYSIYKSLEKTEKIRVLIGISTDKETLKEQGNLEAMQKISQYKKNKAKPFFLWKLYFAEVFQRENPGFDVVIANPPYGIVYDEKIKERYEHNFETFKRNNDIYIAFYQNGIWLLRTEGVLAYITPNTFLNGDYFKAWRNFLTSKTKLLRIRDYKNLHIFIDPTVFVTVLICSKQEKQNYPYEVIIDTARESVLQYDSEPIQIRFASDKKIKAENALLNRLTSIRNCKLADELFYIKDVGFNYWTEGKGKSRDGNSIGSRVFYNNKNKQDSRDISFLKGRDIFKYKIKSPTNYLKYNYERYLDKSKDTFRYSPDFLKQTPKIIYRQTANTIIASLDLDSNYLDKTVHLIVPKDKRNLDYLKFVLGILNSKLMGYVYSYISQELEGRAFVQVKTTYVKQLPIREVPEKEQLSIIKLVDQILSITKDDDYLDNPDKQAKVKKLEKEIDQLVYKLYELTPEEIKIVEECGK